MRKSRVKTKAKATDSRSKRSRTSSVRALRTSLEEAEQALAAIRKGDVDVLVVGGPNGARVFTLEGADKGYRILLEELSEGVAKLNAEGLITYCNARFAAILGAPLERTMGSSIRALVQPSDQARFEALLLAGARERTEGEFLVRDVPVLLSVVPLTIPGGESHCVVMTDLTEQRRNAEVIAAERAALAARLLVVDRMSVMGVVAAGVAHEINNPLAYVIASLELMLGRLPDLSNAKTPASEQVDWLHRQLERAYEGAARVRVIVRDLKAFSRADDETVKAVDLRRVLDASIALVSNEVTLRARLVRDYAELPSVRANESRLEQVFVNLLANAAQAIPAGAADKNEIRVSGRVDATGHAVVEIRDTGSGIPAENLDRIFEPFFTTKAVGVGTGLGLALSHGIVSAFGGRISVESKPGATIFRVVLSAAECEAPVVTATPPAESRGRLLVIDDEKDLTEVLKESLAPFHEVVGTTRARQALEWIAAGQRFDVILCDMKMPEMTGLDFYTHLSALHPEQAACVTLMSGGFARIEKEAGQAFPRAILEKPFDVGQVRALLRTSIRAQAALS